jgi:hypothetical protein
LCAIPTSLIYVTCHIYAILLFHQTCTTCTLNVAVKWTALLYFIQEVLGSNLRLETENLDWGLLCGFSQPYGQMCSSSNQATTGFFLIHYLLTIL